MSVIRPFYEPDLRDHFRLDPHHLGHLLGGHASAPMRGLAVREINEGTADLPIVYTLGQTPCGRGRQDCCDVSKEAASITLLDDNFTSIVAAVEEGRIVFANIKKYLTYLLSSNVGEILLIAGAALAGLPLPLTAVQILYVNLATDGLPALPRAVDPPEPDLMHRQLRNPRSVIFARPLLVVLLTGGVWSAMVNISLFAWLLDTGRPVEQAIAMTFASLVLIQFFKAYNYRSDRLSVFRRPFANHWLNLAIVWELVLLRAIIYMLWLHAPLARSASAPPTGSWSLRWPLPSCRCSKRSSGWSVMNGSASSDDDRQTRALRHRRRARSPNFGSVEAHR
jgi:hypothetical protein